MSQQLGNKVERQTSQLRMCSYLPLRQAKHSEYEQERQKAESVLQHFRERVAEIQAVISSVEKKVGH